MKQPWNLGNPLGRQRQRSSLPRELPKSAQICRQFLRGIGQNQRNPGHSRASSMRKRKKGPYRPIEMGRKGAKKGGQSNRPRLSERGRLNEDREALERASQEYPRVSEALVLPASNVVLQYDLGHSCVHSPNARGIDVDHLVTRDPEH